MERVCHCKGTAMLVKLRQLIGTSALGSSRKDERARRPNTCSNEDILIDVIYDVACTAPLSIVARQRREFCGRGHGACAGGAIVEGRRRCQGNLDLKLSQRLCARRQTNNSGRRSQQGRVAPPAEEGNEREWGPVQRTHLQDAHVESGPRKQSGGEEGLGQRRDVEVAEAPFHKAQLDSVHLLPDAPLH
eukprot:scaffold2285_cov380-Prasinococcus_capsulatus_cf.AAC.2